MCRLYFLCVLGELCGEIIVMPKQKTLRLILGDQLDELHAWFKTPDKNVTYVMMEIRQETDYVKHHIQKVAAFFAAMRAFSARLSKLGHTVIYIRLDDRQNAATFRSYPGSAEGLGAKKIQTKNSAD